MLKKFLMAFVVALVFASGSSNSLVASDSIIESHDKGETT